MTKRIILYAALYGGIGAVVGVLMALYTKDVSVPISLHTTPPQVAVEPSTEESHE
jgi:hypothetical protein